MFSKPVIYRPANKSNLKKLFNISNTLITLLIKLCGLISGISVLLIIIFLFSEASGLFNKPSIDQETVIAISKKNTINDPEAIQIKQIFNREIRNWSALGGKPDSILLFRLDDLILYYPADAVTEVPDTMRARINRLFAQHDNLIGYFPASLMPHEFSGRVLRIPNLNVMDFIRGREWIPDARPVNIYGALPLITGTLWVSLLAILIALPLGLAVAIYMVEIAGRNINRILRPAITLLSGIPSIVYGFFGLVVIVPFIQDQFGLPAGESALAGAILLAIMALPTIISISEQAIRNTPQSMKEASYALGASKWQTIHKVMIPFASRGIIASALLGLARAIGETMAVLMVTGNAAVMPSGFLEPVRTIPAAIAAEMGESTQDGLHVKALFALGCILFVITLLINLSVEYMQPRTKKRMML